MENIKDRESVMIEIVCTSNCVICDKSIVISPKDKNTDDVVENDDYVDDDDDEYSYCEECRNNHNDSYDDKNDDTDEIPFQYKKFIKYNYPVYVKEDYDDDYDDDDEDEDDLYEKVKQNLLSVETDDECYYMNKREF